MLFRSMQRKIKIINAVCICLLVCILLKLAYSQIIRQNVLLSYATDLWERSFPISASRGIILDSKGNQLAINLPVTSIAVIPYQIKDAQKTAESLRTILGGDRDSIYRQISKRTSIVKLNGVGKKISDKQARAIKRLNLDGVYLIQDNLRYYPYEDSLAATIGFVGIDNQGLAGLEAYYDELLAGKDGSLNYIMDAKGGLFNDYQSRLEAPASGMNLQLTINLDIQNSLERELENAYRQYNPTSAYAIAMNPNNGAILGIASRPNYNPNNYQQYSQEIYNRNLPVWKSYEPGSTFKVFSFAAGLEEKVFDMYKDTYYDRGYEVIGGRTIKSWKKGGHGLQTFLEVIENSSNPGFVEISRRVGADKLYDYIKAFGFSAKTGVDIYGESSGIFFAKDNYHELENATTAFGQGISVTAIQMVTGLSCIINGGYLYEPYIVDSIIQGSTGDVLVKKQPTMRRQVISKETSAKMRVALESVVANGTGRNAYIDNYRVGGKTGTAQIAENGVYLDGQYILSFMGAAPMNNPQIVVYVALERPKSPVQYGGTICAPIVKEILLDAFASLDISPQKDELPKEYSWLDPQTYIVENYIGRNKRDLKSANFKFELVGEGDVVIDQIPKVGTRLESGATIVVMLKESGGIL